MHTRLSLILLLLLGQLYIASAQSPGIKVADTLTSQERANRNVVLLRSEVDSIIKANTVPAAVQPTEHKTENDLTTLYLIGGVILFLLLLSAIFIYFLWNSQYRANRQLMIIRKQISQFEYSVFSDVPVKAPKLIRHISPKGSKEDEKKKLEDLNKMVEEYEGLKQQIITIYKVKNYPGYDRSKTEADILKSLLETERSVALYAYDHYVKPVIALADANKNNPAKMSNEDAAKLVQLLVSLALLYTEYLYLRVNDLAIGGKMVQRIKGFTNGNGLDESLLKELNTDHGSRALVLRMALNKMNIEKLSYPVFDETNINLS